MSELLTELSTTSSTDGVVQTGALQGTISSFQAIAEDAGVDINKFANSIGVNKVGDLSKKEDFERLSSLITIDLFSKFKGNLNSTEVRLAKTAMAGLGKTEKSNVRAVAAAQASAIIAQERGFEASKTRTTAEMNALIRRRFTGDGERFKELQNGFIRKMESSKAAINRTEIPDDYKLVGHNKEGKALYQTPDGKILVDD